MTGRGEMKRLNGWRKVGEERKKEKPYKRGEFEVLVAPPKAV